MRSLRRPQSAPSSAISISTNSEQHQRISPLHCASTWSHPKLRELCLYLEPAEATRAVRAVPRRGTIMVSPTQAVPEVPVVWGYDDIRGIVCRRYTIMVAKIPPKITQKTNATKSHQNSATKITSKKRDGNDPTIIAYLRHAARSARCTPPSNPLSRSLHPQQLRCSMKLHLSC